MTQGTQQKKQQGTDLAKLFAGLEITPSEEPLPSFRSGGESTPNPFGPVLLASRDKETPYTIHVPPDAVSRSIFLINAAARKENVGARVVPNIVRGDDNKPVKDKDGKVQYVVETRGEHKGTVMIRFQALKERKKQTEPRLFSIIRDKDNKQVFHVRRRADKVTLFSGPQEQAKAQYARLKQEAKDQAARQAATQPAQTPAAATA